jgi:hypothetical protein
MSSQIVALASESHEEVSQVLSWGVGGGTLALLLLMLAALVVFGGGREHS